MPSNPRRRPSDPTPRVDPVRLADLADASLDDLYASDQREGERYAAADIRDRDLPSAEFFECAFDGLAADGARLRGARFIECTLSAVDGAVLSAQQTTFRDVELSRSRLGSAELFDARWERVRITGCKLGYVNLRGSSLTDVIIEDCTIDELDLGSASVTRVSLQGSRIDTLDVSGARLAGLDLRGVDLSVVTGVDSLRGAIVDDVQLAQLAPMLAAHLGVEVR